MAQERLGVDKACQRLSIQGRLLCDLDICCSRAGQGHSLPFYTDALGRPKTRVDDVASVYVVEAWPIERIALRCEAQI